MPFKGKNIFENGQIRQKAPALLCFCKRLIMRILSGIPVNIFQNKNEQDIG
jgi:hypothetical protein